jgi:hypothetical protein
MNQAEIFEGIFMANLSRRDGFSTRMDNPQLMQEILQDAPATLQG